MNLLHEAGWRVNKQEKETKRNGNNFTSRFNLHKKHTIQIHQKQLHQKHTMQTSKRIYPD